jgi:ABC-2 type transport system permease protein
MRWLLVKDLQILRRSPLLVALLVVYPAIVAVLIGLALSRGPERPKVAFVNLVPAGESTFAIGGTRVDASSYADRLFQAIDPIRVRTREEALAKVRSGEALAALIIPEDITRKLQTGLQQPTVEVVYNSSDPVKQRLVESAIQSRLADANAALSGRFTEVAAGYIRLLLTGGELSIFGRQLDVLGLERSRTILRAVEATLPPGSSQRLPLEQVARFASLAIANLDLSKDVLATVASPIHVKQVNLEGARTPLDAFAVAIAVTISLMLVTVLLASGMLALEREEHAFSRLVRGLVSRGGLLAEKVVLAAGCALAVTVVMLAALTGFVHVAWSSAHLWLPGLALGGLAFGALGVAIGALAREVRAASLLAILLAIPIAFLALVPSGAVSGGLYDAIRVVSAVFPFKPALQAVSAGLSGDGGGLLRPMPHLLALTAAFGVVARVGLRRFG